jgi:hypothetical protein
MREPDTAFRFAVTPGVHNQDLGERLEVCAARSAIVPFPDYAQINIGSVNVGTGVCSLTTFKASIAITFSEIFGTWLPTPDLFLSNITPVKFLQLSPGLILLDGPKGLQMLSGPANRRGSRIGESQLFGAFAADATPSRSGDQCVRLLAKVIGRNASFRCS